MNIFIWRVMSKRFMKLNFTNKVLRFCAKNSPMTLTLRGMTNNVIKSLGHLPRSVGASLLRAAKIASLNDSPAPRLRSGQA